jgi:hypothetical protein
MLRSLPLSVALASALAATVVPASTTELDPAAQERRQRREPQGLERHFRDPAAVEAGRAGLQRMLRAAGAAAWIGEGEERVQGDVWPSLPGLSYQLLETTYQLEERDSDRWRVHHRLPRLVHLAPGDEGYVVTEVVASTASGKDYSATYQRAIVDGPVAWSEYAGKYTRDGEYKSRMLITREQVFGTLPLCLSEQALEVASIRRDDQAELLAVRLPRPSLLGATETVTELVLYVDPQSGLPLQWQFQSEEARNVRSDLRFIWDLVETRELALPEEVRADVERRLVEAWRAARVAAWRADGNQGDPPAAVTEALPDPRSVEIPTSVVIPAQQLMTTDVQTQYKEYLYERPQIGPLPGGALDRPWLTNEVWSSPTRADHWDPPVRSGSEETGD